MTCTKVSGADFIGGVDAELVVGGLARGLEIECVAGAVEGDDRVAVWRAVAHGGVGNADFVLRAFPPGATDGDIDDVMMRFLAPPSVLAGDVLMGLPVGVAGDGNAVRAPLDETVQLRAVFHFGQRNVHHQDDEFFVRHEGEVVFDKGQLDGVESAAVGAFAGGVGDAPLDVVEHDEMHRTVVEAVIVGTKIAVKGLVGVAIVG